MSDRQIARLRLAISSALIHFSSEKVRQIVEEVIQQEEQELVE